MIRISRVCSLALCALLLVACGPDGEEYIGLISRATTVTWERESKSCEFESRTFVLTFYDDGTVSSLTEPVATLSFAPGPPCAVASYRALGGSHADGHFTLRVGGKTGTIQGTVDAFSAVGSGSLHEERGAAGQAIEQHDAYHFRAYR